MISGYISNKCIAQERLDQAQKQYETLNSKIKSKNMDDPIDFVKVKIQTPDFPLLEIDRNIYADNYTQLLREIPTFRQIPELTYEGNKRMLDLLNQYKEKVGLAKLLENGDDVIGEENIEKKTINSNNTTYHSNPTPIPSNPYANISIGGSKGAQGLLGQYVAGEYFKTVSETNTRDYEESNKKNLIRTFKQKTNLGDSEAQFYLEATNYDLKNALEFFNNNK